MSDIGLDRRVARFIERRRVMREMRRETSRAARRVTSEVGTMKAIQRIETGICYAIGTLLAAGWLAAIGELLAPAA